jgi:enoyl-CoA hydratase/carnithine racemase
LHEFPSRGILTIAGIRGNAAAGGVALAAACDVVIAGANVVLNPAYRAVGLFGSEFHTLSYYGRCGHLQAMKILRSMTPMCPLFAQAVGLVDYVFPGTGELLDDYIRTHVTFLLKPGILHRGLWKRDINLSSNALALARAHELGEMSLDFWSPRAVRYHTRRFEFVRKIRATQTPLRFATHRRKLDGSRSDEEERDTFDSVEYFRRQAVEQLAASLRQKMGGEFSEIMMKGRSRGSIASRCESTASHESIATRDSRDSGIEIVAPPERETPSVEMEKRFEPVFSCYYTPPPEAEERTSFMQTCTPPVENEGVTPLSPGETVDRFFSMI